MWLIETTFVCMCILFLFLQQGPAKFTEKYDIVDYKTLSSA